MEINKYISSVVEKRGLKIKALAERVGIPYDYLAKSLNCKRRLTGEELVKLCTYLEIEIKDFPNTNAS